MGQGLLGEGSFLPTLKRVGYDDALSLEGFNHNHFIGFGRLSKIDFFALGTDT